MDMACAMWRGVDDMRLERQAVAVPEGRDVLTGSEPIAANRRLRARCRRNDDLAQGDTLLHVRGRTDGNVEERRAELPSESFRLGEKFGRERTRRCRTGVREVVLVGDERERLTGD